MHVFNVYYIRPTLNTSVELLSNRSEENLKYRTDIINVLEV